MGTLTYDSARWYAQKKSLKTSAEKEIETAKKAGFPNCKGLYPDCPDNPKKDEYPCKFCPVLDED